MCVIVKLDTSLFKALFGHYSTELHNNWMSQGGQTSLFHDTWLKVNFHAGNLTENAGYGLNLANIAENDFGGMVLVILVGIVCISISG